MTLAVLLVGAIYVPAGRTVAGFVSSRRLIQTATPFAPGDVVVFRPNAYATALPRPGDVVLYRNQALNVRGMAGRRNARMRIEGEWVDRVIAGPNSRVVWQNGKLTVNGKPSQIQPLNGAFLPARIELVVPGDACCILPTTNPYLMGSFSEADCVVYQTQLVGQAVARNYPFWRWWWFD